MTGKVNHGSDAGSQYISLHFGESLELHGITPSIGSVGDASDNALGETTIGLCKTECTRPGSPFRSGPFRLLGDVEEAISAWVAWYNMHSPMHRLGRCPPAEFEVEYYAQTSADQPVSVHK